MSKIIIATTFRDFNGNENDSIQMSFLNSLEQQTFKDFELCITIFKEKMVEKVIKNTSINASYFYSDPGVYRYSLTTVLENSITTMKNSDSKLLLWTTCDVQFPKDFFMSLISIGKKKSVYTSHPHYINNKLCSLGSGFDFLVFTRDIALSSKFVDAISRYRNTEWGIFEHFLIALAHNNKAKMYNYFGYMNIFKKENDRVLTDESHLFLDNSWKRNAKELSKYLDDNLLTKSYFSLSFCHDLFKPIKPSMYKKAVRPLLGPGILEKRLLRISKLLKKIFRRS